MTADLDALPFDQPDAAGPTLTGAVGRPKCWRHRWAPDHRSEWVPEDGPFPMLCLRCGKVRDETLSRRGRNNRSYGNRAELKASRLYGGTKVGQAGGPVDIRGKDFATQVKTHRRSPPGEWKRVFTALDASIGRCPRLLLRFLPGPGLPPDDYFVFRGKDFLDWFGRDDDAE